MVGGYSEIPGLMKERFDGLIDEVVFNAEGPGGAHDAVLKKVIGGLHG